MVLTSTSGDRLGQADVTRCLQHHSWLQLSVNAGAVTESDGSVSAHPRSLT